MSDHWLFDVMDFKRKPLKFQEPQQSSGGGSGKQIGIAIAGGLALLVVWSLLNKGGSSPSASGAVTPTETTTPTISNAPSANPSGSFSPQGQSTVNYEYFNYTNNVQNTSSNQQTYAPFVQLPGAGNLGGTPSGGGLLSTGASGQSGFFTKNSNQTSYNINFAGPNFSNSPNVGGQSQSEPYPNEGTPPANSNPYPTGGNISTPSNSPNTNLATNPSGIPGGLYFH
jgi:hypothetical protein